MSKPQNNRNVIRIQFSVKKGEKHFENIEKLLEMYPDKVKSNSIKLALNDLLYIFDTTCTDNSSDLIRQFFKNGNEKSK